MPGSVGTAGKGTMAWRRNGGLFLGLGLAPSRAEVATDGTLGAKVRLTGRDVKVPPSNRSRLKLTVPSFDPQQPGRLVTGEVRRSAVSEEDDIQPAAVIARRFSVQLHERSVGKTLRRLGRP
jgi:hypothetical protein